MSEPMKIKFDSTTRKWFTKHILAETTLMQCEECRLFYKPILGHVCSIARHNGKTTRVDNKIMKEILKEKL